MEPHNLSTGPEAVVRPVVPLSMLCSSALVAMSFGAIFGLIADLQDEMKFANVWLGVVTGAAFLTGFIAQLALSRFADRGFGRMMLIVGLSGTAVACIAMGAANNVGTVLAARLLLGFGEGMYLPAVRRVVILRNPLGVGAALGRLGAAQTAGFLVGPPIAAFLADAFNLRVPFYAVGVALFALLPVVARFQLPPAEEDPHPAALRALVANPGVRTGIYIGIGMMLSIGIGMMLSIGVYDTLWARFLKDLGAGTTFIGVSLTLFGMPIVLFAGRAGRLVDRFGAARMGAIGLIGGSPFIISYGFVKNIWLIAVFAFFHSTFDAAVVPASQAQVANSVTDDLVAASQGLLEGTGMLFAAIAAFASAPLYERFGTAFIWTALAGSVVACALVALRSNAQHPA